jgi:flagellar assembly factor FliW
MRTAEQSTLELPAPRHEDLIQLPLGLLGFEKFKEYMWIESEEDAPFCWLQALHDPKLSFLLLDPNRVLSDYEPSVSDEDVAFLGLDAPSDALIYCVVTLRPSGRASLNLKGPIVLNRFTLRAKQIVLTNAAEYSLQFPLPVAA